MLLIYNKCFFFRNTDTLSYFKPLTYKNGLPVAVFMLVAKKKRYYKNTIYIYKY